MTDELQFLVILSLVFILVVFAISSKSSQQHHEQKSTQQPKPKHKPKSVEIIDTLDWMLERGIITSQEYTKIMGKCLPFLE